jgi:O-antigen/teichoic acid export membrane protein
MRGGCVAVRFLGRNVVLVYGVYAVTIVSGLLLTPIIVDSLGTEQYGVWAVIGSIIAFVGLLDLGIAPSVIRFAAEQRGRRRPEETSGLAATALTLYAVIFAVALLLAVGLAWALPRAMDVPAAYVGAAQVALVIVLLGFAIRFPLGLFSSLLAGQQRYDVINFAGLLSMVLYVAILAAVLLWRGGGLVTLAVVTLLVTLVRLLWPLPWIRRELPTLRIRPSLVTRRQARELVSFSGRNFMIHVASKVVFSTDVIVVGIILGSLAAGLYGVPAKLFAMAFGVGMAVTTLLFPLLSELEGSEEPLRQREYLLSGLRMSLGIVLLASMPLAILPDRFLTAWLGDAGFGESVPVLVLLMASLLFAQPGYMLTQFLVARGRHGRIAVVRLVAVGVNLALSIVLAFTVGIWGVALATLLTEALASAVVTPFLVRRQSGLSLGSLAGAWLRPLVLAAVAAAPTLVAARLLAVDTLLEFAAVAVVWGAAYAGIFWRFGLTPTERGTLRRALTRGSPRPQPALADDV